MSPDDARHGTEAGHQKHRRDGETPCSDCTAAATAAGRLRLIAEPVGLTDGRWVPRGLVLVWEPSGPVENGRAKCGTDGGYYSHLRHSKTPACWECRVAHAKAERERSAAS